MWIILLFGVKSGLVLINLLSRIMSGLVFISLLFGVKSGLVLISLLSRIMLGLVFISLLIRITISGKVSISLLFRIMSSVDNYLGLQCPVYF